MRTSNLFEQVTRQIVRAIEDGAGRFTMPWHRWGEKLATPLNESSGRAYRGINTLLLWAAAERAGFSSGRWATYRQWTAAGAQVRKGEKATPILFWKAAANDHLSGKDGDDEPKPGPRFIARVYSVFNADQVEGAKEVRRRPELSVAERISAAEDFIAATGAQVRHSGDRACYVANIHRLGRDLSGRFGEDAYAMEELVAELGSAFVAAHLGISIEPRRDHAAYIAAWLNVLRGDSRALLTASAKAQEAADFLIARSVGGAARPAPSQAPALAQTG